MSPKAPVTGRHLGLLNSRTPPTSLAGPDTQHGVSAWLGGSLPQAARVGLKGAERQRSWAVCSGVPCGNCASPRVCGAGSQAGAMAGRTVAETWTEGSAVSVRAFADSLAAGANPSLGRQWLQHWKCQCVRFQSEIF